METNAVNIQKVALFTTIGSTALFYFTHLPRYVQGGDSGELVVAAYRLLVAHPPGYPLWIWLQYIFTHIIPIGSVFWRASLLSALFASGALLIIGLTLYRRSLCTLFCVPILALSTAFIEGALLPDVFSLHALFLAAIGSLYLFFEPDSKGFRIGIPFIFFLGIAHHLTMIFLFPIILGVFYEVRREKVALPDTLLSAGFGMCITILLYGSMLLFHTQDRFSWGTLDGPIAIWHHFLRSDYGTFRLAAEEKIGTFGGVWFFVRSSWLELCGLLGISMIVILNNKCLLFERRALVWGSSCLLAVAFFYVANVVPIGMGEEVLHRFCIIPILQITLLVAYLVQKGSLTIRYQIVLIFLALTISTTLGFRALDFVGLHNDSIFEDYASNMLNQAEQYKPAVVLTQNENAYFGMRYIQAILSRDQDVLVVIPNLFFHPWYLKKIQQIAQNFQLSDPRKIWSTRKLDIEKDLLGPNMKNFSIIVSKGYQNGKNYHTTFLGLGRIVQEGSGLDFNDESPNKLQLRTLYKEHSIKPQNFSKGLLYSEYSHFYLARGLFKFASGHKDKALEDWKTALNRVPFALPALTNFCNLKNNADPLCTETNLAETRAEANRFL